MSGVPQGHRRVQGEAINPWNTPARFPTPLLTPCPRGACLGLPPSLHHVPCLLLASKGSSWALSWSGVPMSPQQKGRRGLGGVCLQLWETVRGISHTGRSKGTAWKRWASPA